MAKQKYERTKYSASSLPVAGLTTVLPVATRLALARITGLLLFRGLVRFAKIAGGRTTARMSQSAPASTTPLSFYVYLPKSKYNNLSYF